MEPERSPWERAAEQVAPERPVTRGLIGAGVLVLLIAFAVNTFTVMFTATWDPGEDCEIATDGRSDGVIVRWPAPASVICEGGTQLVPAAQTVFVILCFALGCVLIALGRRASARQLATTAGVTVLVPALVYGATAWFGSHPLPPVSSLAAVPSPREVPRSDISVDQARSGMQAALDGAVAAAGGTVVPVGDPTLMPGVHEWSCLDGGREYAIEWSFTVPGQENDPEHLTPETEAVAERIRSAWIAAGWVDEQTIGALSFRDGPGGGSLSVWPTLFGTSIAGTSACVDAMGAAGPDPKPTPLEALRFDLAPAAAQSEVQALVDATVAAGTSAGATWTVPGSVERYSCADELGSTVSFTGALTTGPIQVDVNGPFPTAPPPGDAAVFDRIAETWSALGYVPSPGAQELRDEMASTPTSSALDIVRIRQDVTGVVIEIRTPCIAEE